MESLQMNTQPVIAVPQRRQEVHFPFRKYVLPSDFGVPSRDPSTGAPGGVQLYWTLLRETDPNNYISLQPGYITLNKPGIYLVAARVSFRLVSPANTQRLLYMQVTLNGLAGANQGDGDTARASVSKSATSSLYVDESSPGAGDSGGSSLLVTSVFHVIPDTIYAPPRAVFVNVYQESDSLQGQNINPLNYDTWLQAGYVGYVDTLVDGATLRTLQ